MIRTKGSLCSGTGALDLATPGELQWIAEKEMMPSLLLKREYPDVPNFGDITNPDSFTHVDLLTSGDPCQSMSVAGRQAATADERFLWPHVMDIIRKVRPNEIFLENVQNIVSVPLIKGGPRGGVLLMRLEDLTNAGYDVRWATLGACSVGAPHHRHRWFLRARYVGRRGMWTFTEIPCGAPRSGGRVLLPTPTTADGRGGPGASGRDGGLNLRTAVQLLPTPRATDIGTPGRRSSEGWRPQLGQAVLEHLLPTPTARDADGRGEGSAEHWDERAKERSNGMPLGAQVGLLPSPRATDGRKGDLAMGSACQPEHWGKYAPAIALWEETLGRPAPEPTELAPKGGRRLNAALSEWMMGYPEGYLAKNFPRNEALKMAGNGVVGLQARAAWGLLDFDR